MKIPFAFSFFFFSAVVAALIFLDWRQGGIVSENREFSLGDVLGETIDDFPFRSLEGPPELIFPRDHADHPDFRNEWWYFTGNLKDGSGGEYGYQVTIFRNRLPKNSSGDSAWDAKQVYMGHFGFTDVSSGKFYSGEIFERENPGRVGIRRDPLRIRMYDRFSVELSREGDEREVWKLSANLSGVELRLSLVPSVPITLQGNRGYSRKGERRDNASAYYSIMRLETEGTAKIGNREIGLKGESWFDREWSTSALDAGTVGWDWFAIQFEGEGELMLYRLRKNDGAQSPFSYGIYRTDGGNAVLAAKDFKLEVLEEWESPSSGARYPSVFRAEIPKLDLAFVTRPKLADQEHRFVFRYWEGAVSVNAEMAGRKFGGRGYLELAGY